MKTEVKQKWLEALRNGRYLQTRGYLRDMDMDGETVHGYCCLGVLCDVIEPNNWLHEAADHFGNVRTRAHRLSHPEAEELSPDALSEMGITDSQQCALVNMNDDEGLDFSDIADWIEENVEAEAA